MVVKSPNEEFRLRQAFFNHASRFEPDEVLSIVKDLHESRKRPITHLEILDELIQRKGIEFKEKYNKEGDLFTFDLNKIRSKLTKVLRKLADAGYITEVSYDALDPDVKLDISRIIDEHGYLVNKIVIYEPL